MMRSLLLVASVIHATVGNSQDHRMQVYDLAAGKADQARDCLINDSSIFINSYYWNGQEAVSGNLTLMSTLDSLFLSKGDSGFTKDDNMIVDGDDLLISGHENNRRLKIVRRDKESGAVTQVKVIEPAEPQLLFAMGIVALDSQYVVACESLHDTSTLNVNEMYVYWLDKVTLEVDTVVHVHSSPSGHIYEIRPFGDNGIVALVDTLYLPLITPGPYSPFISRQLLTFNGDYRQQELYRVDSLQIAHKWANCLVNLPNGNFIVDVSYDNDLQYNLECISPSGELVWDYLLPDEWYRRVDLTNLAVAEDGDILASGSYRRSDREAGIIFRLSPEGDLRWIKLYEIPDAERWMDISFADVNQLDEDRLVVVGHVTVTETLDPIDGNYYPNQNTLVMTVDNDGCYNGDCSDIIQLDIDDLIITSTSDVPPVIEAAGLSLSPNPTTGITRLEEAVTGSYTVYGLGGEVLLTGTLAHSDEINLSGLPAGQVAVWVHDAIKEVVRIASVVIAY